MNSVGNLTEEEITQVLAYAGLILVAFELVRSLIIKPVKAFYANVTFGKGIPFKSYEEDVLSRHKNEFEACLLYLRDFMKAIDDDDFQSIQELRRHRNELAHDLAYKLPDLKIESYARLFKASDRALFKLSNHQTYIEIGANPEFKDKGIDWNTVEGHEYIIFKEVLSKIQGLKNRLQ